jgi:hypothetical protein
MTSNENEVYKVICSKAIKRCKKIKFYYKSSGGNYFRTVEPYLIGIRENGKVYVTGYEYPSKERQKKRNDYGQGQWLLNRISLNKLEVLVYESFNKLKVPAERIFGAFLTVTIICRVSAKKMGI